VEEFEKKKIQAICIVLTQKIPFIVSVAMLKSIRLDMETIAIWRKVLLSIQVIMCVFSTKNFPYLHGGIKGRLCTSPYKQDRKRKKLL